MKKLYKPLLIIAVFWIGFLYANMSSDVTSNARLAPTTQARSTTTPAADSARPALNEEIRNYEEAIQAGERYTPYSRNTNPTQAETSQTSQRSNERSSNARQNNEQATSENSTEVEITDNIVSRGARHIGDFSQTVVRESLRNFVRFFDGVIR